MAVRSKFYAVAGERGFPHYIIRESIASSGSVVRTMIATCNNQKYVEDILRRLNESEEVVLDG